ncbi:MAG: Crp/Fnr family transcriptional regulator [Fibrobacterota bacterium]
MADFDFSALTFCPLFRVADADEIAALFAHRQYRIVSYPAGRLIHCAGDVCDALYIPVKGSVRGELTDSAGSAIYVEDIVAPNPVAPAFLFEESGRFPVDLCAVSKVRLMRIPKKEVLSLMKESEPFLIAFLALVSRKAAFLKDKMEFLSFNTIREKLAVYLQKQTRRLGSSFTLPHSQEKLAKIFGVTRPSLSRELKHLRDEGIITMEGRQVTVSDPDRL